MQKNGKPRRLVVDKHPEQWCKLKKPILMVEEGNCSTKIASFNDEASADLFIEVVNDFIRRENLC